MKLQGFPGELKKTKHNRGCAMKFTATPEQEQWILTQYKDESVSVRDIAETIGTSNMWVKNLCHRHGLTRDTAERLNKFKHTLELHKRRQEDIRKVMHSDNNEPDKSLLLRIRQDVQVSQGPCIGPTCYLYMQCNYNSKGKKRSFDHCDALF